MLLTVFHIFMILAAAIAIIAVAGLWIFCLCAVYYESVPLFRYTKHDQD